MYNIHFGFREKPFKLVPNPEFLYLSKSHQIALAHLAYAVDQGDGFVVITGEVGTGKTTLCRHFLERLDQDTESAYIFNPRLNSAELLRAISNEYGLQAKHDGIQQQLDTINAFLISQNKAGRKVILLIDEAQNLSLENLEMVRMLSNLETTRSKLLQIILVGQPELGDKLDSYELRQLAQRISLSAHLAPFGMLDTIGYIQHRVNIAAQRPVSLFTRHACRAIHKYARGIPRLINIACDRALLTAFSLDRPKVTAAIARQAMAELAGRGRRQRHWISGRVLMWSGIALATGIAVWHLLLSQAAFFSLAGPAMKGQSGQMGSVTHPVVRPSVSDAIGTGGSSTDMPLDGYPSPSRPIDDQSSPKAGTRDELLTALQGLSHHRSRLDAVTSLLACWRQPDPHPQQLPATAGDAVYFDIAAHQYGLRMLAVQEDLPLIRNLDLPAILAFRLPGAGYPVYMTLIGWQENIVQLAGAAESPVMTCKLETVIPFLEGSAYLFWKNLTGFDGIVTSAAPHNAILAVKNMLRRSGYDQLDPTPVFDTQTHQSVLDFQIRNHLTPDGLVGPLTKILLTRESHAIELPALIEKDSGGGA